MKSTLVLALIFLSPLAQSASLDSPKAVCENQAGGTYEQGRDAEDIAPLCTIDGGLIRYETLHSVIKEKKTTQATEAFLKHPKFSAAVAKLSVDDQPEAYCRQLNGKPVTYRDGQGIKFGMCEFKDGSAIAEHTLLVGPRMYPALARVLKG